MMQLHKSISKLSGSACQSLHQGFLMFNQKRNSEHNLLLSPPIFPMCGCCAFMTVAVFLAGRSKTCLPSCAGWHVGTAVEAGAVLGPGLWCCITHRWRLISWVASEESSEDRDFLGRENHWTVQMQHLSVLLKHRSCGVISLSHIMGRIRTRCDSSFTIFVVVR